MTSCEEKRAVFYLKRKDVTVKTDQYVKKDFIIFNFLSSACIVHTKWFGPIINLLTNSNFNFY